MFYKLTLRNIKRQLSNYVIYFVTVSLTVSMMFALCNLIFSEQLLSYASAFKEMQSTLILISVAVSLIVALILGYASSFMLKLRKREFGTYLTLGMSRGNIFAMYLIETLTIGLVALACGLLMGLLIYQGLIGIVARVLEFNISFGSYSLKGLLLTAALAVGTYLLSTVASFVYIRKVSVYELLHSANKVTKKVKKPLAWFVLTIVASAMIVAAILGVNKQIELMYSSYQTDLASNTGLLSLLFVLLLGVVLFHIGLSKSIMYMLLKSKKLKSKGANTFVLRQLSGQLNTNSAICCIIAFLITAAILSTNVSFAQKSTFDSQLKSSFPFDISVNLSDIENDAPYDRRAAEDTIAAHATVAMRAEYTLYSTGKSELQSHTIYSGEEYADEVDHFISLSDFNMLVGLLGYGEIELSGSFLALTTPIDLSKCNFADTEIVVDGVTYAFLKVTSSYPTLSPWNYTYVIPDDAVKNMTVAQKKEVLNLTGGIDDVQALYDALCYTAYEEDYEYEVCPLAIREYYKVHLYSLSAINIVSELYIAIIFVFMSTAILTMKLFAETAQDQRRYTLLNKVGADRRQRATALFSQTFAIFAFPFVLPLLLSIPTALICAKWVYLSGFTMLATPIYQNAAIIAGIVLIIQILYFVATYFTRRKNVLGAC